MSEERLATSTRVADHHEFCDSRDPMIPGKPCNCYLHWREKYAEAAEANIELHGDVNQLRNAMKAICNADTLDAAQHIAGCFVFCNHGKPMTENCPQCREEDIAWAKLIRAALAKPEPEQEGGE